jgi:methylated-DNA-protein-cysteine methyltransferase related protein
VKFIPPNKVVYFGQIADRVGVSAQIVGFMLSGMSVEESKNIPWYRVVSKNGYISALKLGYKGEVQREILLREGYEVVDNCVNMQKHLWDWET